MDFTNKKKDILAVVAILDFTKIIKTDIIKDYPRNIQGKFVLKWFSGFEEENFKIICALKRGDYFINKLQ